MTGRPSIPPRQRRTREVVAALGASAILAALVPFTTSPAVAAGPGSGSGLGKHDRQLLADARAAGDRTVTLLIASRPGANRTVASGLSSLGATIRKREDDLGYLRAIVPIGKAELAARVTGVQAADLDEIIPLDDPHPDGTQDPTPQTPPGPSTAKANAYLPTEDIGAVTFKNAHPTWDGRGTTIGILDSGIDLGHPALQSTTTGERKITDWVTYTDPTTDGDPTWVNMADQVKGGSFTYQNVGYTAPAAGSFRIGLFDERDARLGGEVGNDVNRDGNPAGSSGIFAVLWDAKANNVWVDTNQNGSFADEQTMTDYKVRYDVGTFGTDNPATNVREAMPFVVQTDGTDKYVNIGIVSGSHGTHVAGIAAGNGFFDGAFDGVAPGAKITSIRVCLFIAGCTASGLVEGMIFAAKQANVDIINMSIGGLPALNDGNNTRVVLYNRLIDQYGVQIFLSAGNDGAGINTLGDPAVADHAVSMGSYITKETWQKNYGSDSTYVDNLHGFSSRGPTEAGGFKPNLVAPGSAIASQPTWLLGSPVAGTYTLPPGYAMMNGTSMASPEGAGAGALLVSAAKQAGVQKQPAQLRQALYSSARFLPRYGAYEQGNGLLNIPAAWEVLKQKVKPVGISSSVAVHTVLSNFLATPGVGVGIYDREGVSAGDSYTRTYTFSRSTGNTKAVTYNLSWVGNDGTFATAGTLALGYNKPTTLDVTVHPTSSGAHSAILNVDDPSTPGVDYQTLNTVIAAETFTADNSYSITHSGTIGRNQVTSYFVAVPPGTPAFKVDLVGGGTTPDAGQIRFLRFHPYGVGIDVNQSTSCYNPSAGSCASGSPTSRTTSNPMAGVWEVVVEARRTSDVENAPYTLTMSILGALVSPNPDVIESATVGTPVARSYTAKNLFGAFTGRMVGTTLGSARLARPNIIGGAQQQREVTVTAGSTSLRATIGNPSDLKADLDLFVYNCTTGSCVLAGQSADGDSEESVTIASPAPGLWVVLVDGFAVPSGATDFDYLDVFTNPAFGTVAVTDANASRPAGSSWTAPASVTAGSAPAADRVLLGNVQVRTDTNVLVGSGDVIVRNVE